MTPIFLCLLFRETELAMSNSVNIATQQVAHYDSGFEWCDKPDLVGQTIIATFHTSLIDRFSSIEPCDRLLETVSLQKAQILKKLSRQSRRLLNRRQLDILRGK